MRIARFGDTYAGGYEFSKALMDDTWQSARPPITQAVSGASGAFDFYGSSNYPIAPVAASKKFAITGTSSANLEDSLITLRAATIAADRSKLWWLDRDDSTKYWSWAKCVRLKDSDTYKEKGRWLKNVDIGFYMSEGVWYAETQQTDSLSDGDNAVTVNGNIDSVAKLVWVNAAGALTRIRLENSTTGEVVQWDGTLGVVTDTVTIDGILYVATKTGSDDEYSQLTLPTGQIPWILMNPGSNTMNLTAVGSTGATVTLYSWATYLF